MKKVAILIPCLKGGGAERVATILANNLAYYYDADIINIEEGLSYDLKVKRIVLSKLDCKTSKWKKLILFPYQFFKLSQFLKTNRYDVVISFMERVSFMLYLLRYEKSIYSFRNYQEDQISQEQVDIGLNTLRKMIYTYFLKNSYKRNALITTISKEAQYNLVIRFGIPVEKIKVIYNPYEIEMIETMKQEDLGEYKPIFEYPVIINVGRLMKQKGQRFLLEAFKMLKRKIKESKLIILGEGELKKELVEFARHLELKVYIQNVNIIDESYDVYFLGFQKNPFKFIANSKLFVFSSLWEGFPNALVEAMACGVPVVSSDCRSGPREILAPETDYLVKTKIPDFAKYGVLMPVFGDKDKEQNYCFIWAEVLTYLLENNSMLQKYLSLAYKRAKDFDVKKIIPEWVKTIDDISYDS